MQMDISLLSISWLVAKTALYGSTTVSDTWRYEESQGGLSDSSCKALLSAMVRSRKLPSYDLGIPGRKVTKVSFRCVLINYYAHSDTDLPDLR